MGTALEHDPICISCVSVLPETNRQFVSENRPKRPQLIEIASFKATIFMGAKALSFRESCTASPGRPSKVSVTEEVDHLVASQNTAKWRFFFLDEMVGVSKLVKQN